MEVNRESRTDSYIYVHLIYDKVATAVQWEEDCLSINSDGSTDVAFHYIFIRTTWFQRISMHYFDKHFKILDLKSIQVRKMKTHK